MRFVPVALLLMAAAAPLAAQAPTSRTLPELEARRDSLERELAELTDSIDELRRSAMTSGDSVFHMRSIMHGQAQLQIVGYDEAFLGEPSWLYRTPSGSVKVEDVDDWSLTMDPDDEAQALAYFRGQARKPTRELLIGYLYTSEPDVAGGVSVSMGLRNMDPTRTIKYLDLDVVPYNAVGDSVQDRLTGRRSASLRLTGPVAPGEMRDGLWSPWYNATIRCAALRRVEVEYTDGSRYVYVRELPEIVLASVPLTCPRP